jgi:hypothetical protein
MAGSSPTHSHRTAHPNAALMMRSVTVTGWFRNVPYSCKSEGCGSNSDNRDPGERRATAVPRGLLSSGGYQVGYLAGGARRAAEVVIGELTASVALRVDSSGQVSQAAPAELTAWSATCARGLHAEWVLCRASYLLSSG